MLIQGWFFDLSQVISEEKRVIVILSSVKLYPAVARFKVNPAIFLILMLYTLKFNSLFGLYLYPGLFS